MMIKNLWDSYFFGDFQKITLAELNGLDTEQNVNAFIGFSYFHSGKSSFCEIKKAKLQLLVYACDFSKVDFTDYGQIIYVESINRVAVNFKRCCFDSINNGYAFDVRSQVNESKSDVSYVAVSNIRIENGKNVDALCITHEFFKYNNYSNNNCLAHPGHYSDSTYSEIDHVVTANSNSSSGIFLFAGSLSTQVSIFYSIIINNIGTGSTPLIRSRSKMFLTNCYICNNINVNTFYVYDSDVNNLGAKIIVYGSYLDKNALQYTPNNNIIISSATTFEEPQLKLVSGNCRFLESLKCPKIFLPAKVLAISCISLLRQ